MGYSLSCFAAFTLFWSLPHAYGGNVLSAAGEAAVQEVAGLLADQAAKCGEAALGLNNTAFTDCARQVDTATQSTPPVNIYSGYQVISYVPVTLQINTELGNGSVGPPVYLTLETSNMTQSGVWEYEAKISMYTGSTSVCSADGTAFTGHQYVFMSNNTGNAYCLICGVDIIYYPSNIKWFAYVVCSDGQPVTSSPALPPSASSAASLGLHITLVYLSLHYILTVLLA